MGRITRYITSLLLLLATIIAQAQAPALLNIRGTVFENESLHPMEGAAV